MEVVYIGCPARIGGIWEKTIFMVIPMLNISQFQDQRNKKEVLVRVGRRIDVDIGLQSGANNT